jgi:6-phosphogluconolactonase (cycloisomerase 2 family)
MKTKILLSVIGAAMSVATLAAETSANGNQSGHVYVMTNKPSNSVLVYDRASNGSLTFMQEATTNGSGTGVTLDPLMSQGALALNPEGDVLLAVNPASGELSAFKVTNTGVQFGSKVLSGGDFPVSVTAYNGVVYVLNQLGAPNISGFTVDSDAQLIPIPSSVRNLAGGALAQPAQVSFTPDGRQIIVTEKGTRTLDVFNVAPNGLTHGPFAQFSSGNTPFGFAFSSSGSLIIAEAGLRLPLKGTTSSYRITAAGQLQSTSRAVRDNQTAACWVAVTENVAWVVNTGTAVISSYEVGDDGGLTLANPMAAFTGTGSTPIDNAASSDGAFIYQLISATGEIAIFSVNGTSLTPMGSVSGLPLSIQGIDAR